MSASVKKDELLKAVADVLDEAIATYEQLEKMDLDMKEVEDPSKAKKSEPAAAPAPAPIAEAKEEEEEKEEDEKDEEKKDEKDMDKASLKMKKEEEPKEDEEEEDEKEEDKKDESDDQLMATYKSLVSKMEKRGLIKAEPQAPIGNKSMQKSEASEQKTEDKSEEKIEALKKSFDERVEDITKKIESIAKAVESISKSPAAPRRGLSGATPLRKSETETKPSVTKLQALDKLVELRKSGDQRVDTGLITRLEMGKLTSNDYERLNSILG